MDRTSATGTGFIAQYPPAVAAMYESVDTTPDELLLFMHHVPYTHVLKSGKTVIQHIYDDHYQGADEAAALCRHAGGRSTASSIVSGTARFLRSSNIRRATRSSGATP